MVALLYSYTVPYILYRLYYKLSFLQLMTFGVVHGFGYHDVKSLVGVFWCTSVPISAGDVPGSGIVRARGYTCSASPDTANSFPK